MAKLSGFNLGEKFNANDHKELDDFSAIPAGQYVGKIIESKDVENKAKTGSYLKLTFQVTEGEFKGRKLWTNLNLDHPTAEAVEIAERTLASIIKACGKVVIEDSEEIHGIEMELKVTEKAATPNYPASNEIKNFKPLDGVENPSGPSNPGSSGSGEVKKKSRVSF
ncbi:MAG: DUF669 domain-containing protein [Actinomycetia bacterium]|nr:DUF669 domain-containing protein [Actinomycetes bacterium]